MWHLSVTEWSDASHAKESVENKIKKQTEIGERTKQSETQFKTGLNLSGFASLQKLLDCVISAACS